MAKSNNQKGKILYLEHLLCETGEKHAVSMQEILSFLQSHGISAERKSIYDDMEVLRSFGMDIRFRRGKPGGYFLAGLSETAGRTQIPPLKLDGPQPEQEAPRQEDAPPPKKEERVPEVSVMPSDEGEEPGRALRLALDEKGREAVEKTFGESAQIREKEAGSYLAFVEVQISPRFYGWLAAQGSSVKIVKPKKAGQAYREYLKSIAKEYKSPEK